MNLSRFMNIEEKKDACFPVRLVNGLRPRQIFSHVGKISCLPWFNHYEAVLKVS